MDAWVVIGFSATVVDLPDALDETGVFTIPLGGRTVFPVVVAAP